MGFLDSLPTDTRPSMSDWAEREIFMPEEETRPGLFRLDNWQRPIVEAFSDDIHRQVSLMLPSQVGKSTLQSIPALYVVAYPGRLPLIAHPTGASSDEFVNQKLLQVAKYSKQVRDSLRLTRDGTVHKDGLHYEGGIIRLATSKSKVGFRQTTSDFVIADEVDLYESTKDATNPLDLLRQRGEAFKFQKLIVASTPTTKGSSLIEKEYLRSDMREWCLPCPHCNELFIPEFENVRELEGLWQLACSVCGSFLTEDERVEAAINGKWVAQNPDVQGHAGFHITQLAIPTKSLDDTMRGYDENNPRSFYTQKLALPYADTELPEIEPDELADLYTPAWDAPVYARTMTCDWQQNRLEYMAIDWHGSDFKNLYPFIVEHQTIGVQDENFAEGFRQLARAFKNSKADVLFCDAGGPKIANLVVNNLRTAFPNDLRRGRVRAIRGNGKNVTFERSLTESAITGDPTIKEPGRTDKILSLNVRKLRVMVYEGMLNQTMRFNPNPAYLPENFSEQMVSETLKRVQSGAEHVEKLRWVKKPNVRNEAFDLATYGFAALEYLGDNYRRAGMSLIPAIGSM